MRASKSSFCKTFFYALSPKNAKTRQRHCTALFDKKHLQRRCLLRDHSWSSQGNESRRETWGRDDEGAGRTGVVAPRSAADARADLRRGRAGGQLRRYASLSFTKQKTEYFSRTHVSVAWVPIWTGVPSPHGTTASLEPYRAYRPTVHSPIVTRTRRPSLLVPSSPPPTGSNFQRNTPVRSVLATIPLSLTSHLPVA
jgi:hypothetical protein